MRDTRKEGDYNTKGSPAGKGYLRVLFRTTKHSQGDNREKLYMNK